MPDQSHEERAALIAAVRQHEQAIQAQLTMGEEFTFIKGWQARGVYDRERLATVESENARLREMLAEMLGHMEPLAHHAILGPVGSPREWVSEGREMARQAMLNVGRWGVAALASVPGATGEGAGDTTGAPHVDD